MRKLILYLTLHLSLFPLSMTAQTGAGVKEEKDKLIRFISYISIDSTIVDGVSNVIRTEVDSIYHVISSAPLTDLEKEKAERSLVYFMKELSEKITQQKFEMYDIPAALHSYKEVLRALLYHKPYVEQMMSLGPRRSQLIAGAFSQYNEHVSFDEIAAYKRVAAAPEFILPFLETKPGFRYSDSLMLITAINDPEKFISYINTGNSGVQQNIRNSKNIYLQQIVSLSADKNTTELLPFVASMAENKITTDSILRARMDVTKYFQLLVNTLEESNRPGNISSGFQKLLRDGLKEKSLAFYVKPINELHSAADAARFASVKAARPEDIYYIITSSGDELYTSSYLGLYKRLMGYFNNQSADSLFEIVHYDNFRTFMRLAANYNTLGNFLSTMRPEKATVLLKRFIAGIESDTNTGLEKAMDIADSFTGLGSANEITGLIEHELQSNLKRCQSGQQYFGIRLYSILLQVFDLVKQKDDLSKLWGELGNYEILKRSALRNKNGEIVELVLFYGDEDGIASFNNFQKLFADNKKWEISKSPSWITIRSFSDKPIVIYANLPLDNKEELDLKAQDSLTAFLDQQSIEPAVLIHRGHSYHLPGTIKKLKPSVRLAILGSCGAYNSAISIATINPDVQIIGSKKMGSKSINDPIIEVINETLLTNNDLMWPGIWEQLKTRFSKDEVATNLFNEYIPPGKNVSLFVLKLFNFYNRPVDVANTR